MQRKVMSAYYFSIAVFAANEGALIGSCIDSIDRACVGYSTHISVLLNGTSDLSEQLLRQISLKNADLTVYIFDVADKANVINNFFHDLRPEAKFYFCIDGYVRIGEGSLRAMDRAFADHSEAVIASAVPVTGRSAAVVHAETVKGGVTNGQFYGLRQTFVARLVAAGIRLPLQHYRVDGLLGSMAAHDLDATGRPWNRARIIGAPGATFAIKPLSIFKMSDIKRQYIREIRQARGLMENEAIKSIIYKDGYAALPYNSNDMIETWLATNRPQARSLREHYFLSKAKKNLRVPRIKSSTYRTRFDKIRMKED